MKKHIISLLVLFLLISTSMVGVSNQVTDDSFAVQQDSYQYMTDWSVNLTNQTTSEEIYGPFYSNVESRDDTNAEMNPLSHLMNSSWPMSCHDTHHTSQSPISTANNPGTEKWRCKTLQDAGTVESGAIVDDNGIIYFGSMGADHYLYALYPNGTLKWKYRIPGIIWSTPAIANDGTIYVGDWDGHLSAINQNGSLKWQIYRSGQFHSSPVIGDDGTIYLGHSSGNLYAINPDGTEKWLYDAGDQTTSDPAIGEEGTIYIGSGDNYLYAVYPNGTLHWRYLTGGVIKGHPSIAPNRTIYIPSFDGYLYALHPDGTLIWKIRYLVLKLQLHPQQLHLTGCYMWELRFYERFIRMGR